MRPSSRLLPWGAILLFSLLLASGGAVAHFHMALVVDEQRVHVTQTGAASAEVRSSLLVRNPGNGTYEGILYVPLPQGATAVAGDVAGEPVDLAPPLGRVSLAGNRSLAPNGTLVLNVSYRVEGTTEGRLLVPVQTLYETGSLVVTASAQDGFTATGVGFPLGEPAPLEAREGGSMLHTHVVAFDEREVPRLVWLVGFAVLLVAGAWGLDRWRKRRGK